MKKTTKRRLRPWVKATLKFIASFVVICALGFGFLFALAEEHHQRAEYWAEVGGY